MRGRRDGSSERGENKEGKIRREMVRGEGKGGKN